MRAIAIGIGIGITIWLTVVGVFVIAGRQWKARELAALIPNLAVMFTRLLRDRRVPLRPKVLLAVGALWIASPIDPIPEFIPVVGVLDDAVVAIVLLRYLLKRAGPALIAEHWPGDPATLERLLALARFGRAAG